MHERKGNPRVCKKGILSALLAWGAGRAFFSLVPEATAARAHLKTFENSIAFNVAFRCIRDAEGRKIEADRLSKRTFFGV